MDACAVAIAWAASRSDTLVLVTADHETGGLTVKDDNGVGQYPSVIWSTDYHTGANVPVYAAGRNAELVYGVMDNTDMFDLSTIDNSYVAGQPFNPYPRDGDTDVPLTVTLSWETGSDLSPTDYDVYWVESADALNWLAHTNLPACEVADLVSGRTYYWLVSVTYPDQTVVEGPVWSFTAAIPPPAAVFASGETTAKGTALAGDYSSTFASDNTYEALQEVINVPNRNGYSTLDHTWVFQLDSSASAEFRVEAHHSNSIDGDDFVLAYSRDGSTYTDMLTITKRSDTDTPQVYTFPGPLSGTVYIRVVDTNHDKANQQLDTLWVDHLYIWASQAGRRASRRRRDCHRSGLVVHHAPGRGLRPRPAA